jgi:multidrug efflux pump subunit AcrB
MKKSTSQTTLQTTKNSFNFNLWLTKLFLDNTRLALVSVGVLVILGVASTFLIKSIGFPNPEIKVALIQTVYPGASSDVVNREISIPLEGAVKGVKGVDSITVNSNNSVSIMTVQIKSDVDADSVKNKISTAIAGVSLPEDSQKPELVELSVGGPDFILSVVDKDLERVYEVSENLIADVGEYSEVASIKSPNPLEKKLIIKLDNDKLAQSGILASDIIASLQKVGETLPVVSGVQIDNRPQSIVTSLKGDTVEDVKNLEFSANIPPQILAQNSLLTANRPTFKLSDLATVEMKYRFANDKPSVIALASDEEDKVFGTQILEIKTSQGNDLGKFATKLEEQLKSYENVKFVSKSDSDLSAEGTRIIENYSAAYENGKQLDEVISGLIGGKLDVANPNVANLGWLLGGIQLVFLVMLAFVSWRAAIISALAIPLSLVFSIIYLYFIGESLNTLVLFSLVLVIGLVVDPALVILEAIQRKIDIGLKGREASLAAVKDVGMGIFLATITNIIVFVPFAVISGLLGEIFAYIPLTIVPATIGSYIVPLAILSWLGGLILKPTKNSTDDEEQNMWCVSKALKKLNLFILNSNVFVRLGIVILGFVIPLSITWFYFSTGKVVSVSFSSNDNSDLISLNGKYRYDLSNEDTLTTTQNVLNTLAENEAVRQVYPFETGGEGFYYYIELYPKAEREGVSSKDVERDLKDKMSKYDDKFFEYNVALLSQGPPSPLYQVALSIQGQEVQNRKKAGLEMGEVLSKTCLVDGKIGFEENCEGEKIVKKVDDGFSGKENLVLDVSLDPKTLRDKSLTLGNTSNGSIPVTFLVNSTIRDQFEQNRGQKVTDKGWSKRRGGSCGKPNKSSYNFVRCRKY